VVESIKELRRLCQDLEGKRKPSHFYEYLFSHRISIYLTKILLYTKITANQVTFISISTGILGALFLSIPKITFSIIGVILIQLWNILDCVDGEIATYKKSKNITGRYFDVLSNYIVEPFIFICLAVGLYLQDGKIFILFCGVSSSFSSFLAVLVTSIKHTTLLEKLRYFSHHKHFALINEEKQPKENSNEYIAKRTNLQKASNAIFRFPGIMNIITIAVILNGLGDYNLINLSKLNLLEPIVIFYGLTLPYFWIKTLYRNIKRGLEKDYLDLLNRPSL